jgi:hypothetical protein
MSIRRAVEAHIKFALDPYIPGNGATHVVVESLRSEERPMPAVVISAGSAQPAMPEFPDSAGNWKVPITVAVMASFDDTTVNIQSDVAHLVSRVLRAHSSRFHSKVTGLYVYDIQQGSTGQDNQGRRMVNVLNFDALVNFVPEAPIS